MVETRAEHLVSLIITKNLKIIPEVKCPEMRSTSVYYSERKNCLHSTPFFATV